MALEKRLKIGNIEGAPPWVGTPFDKLHFEWTREEALELDRYCEKINKNISEEDMTPRARFDATLKGKKEKDRLHFETKYNMPFGSRTLDSWADAVKPGDTYKWPKLHVKAHLATAARYKIDIINVYVISYGEMFFGANVKLMDYGTPMVLGDPPLKTMEDVMATELPDPKKHGLHPGYLWGCREIIKQLKDHKCELPVELSYCGGPMGTVMQGNIMMSMPIWMRAARKDPDLAKAAFNLASEWSIKFGKAVKELKPDGMYLCDTTGSTSPENTEWTADYYTMIGKAVRGGDKNLNMWLTGGGPGFLPWMPVFVKHGAMGPERETFDGWWIGPDLPPKEVYDFYAEHNLYCGCSVSDVKMLDGDWSIEDDIKVRCELAKRHPRHMACLGVLDYWTPPEHFDKCIAWTKKYGKF